MKFKPEVRHSWYSKLIEADEEIIIGQGYLPLSCRPSCLLRARGPRLALSSSLQRSVYKHTSPNLRRNPRFSLSPHSHWRLNTVAFQLGNNEGKGSSPHRPWPPSPAPTGASLDLNYHLFHCQIRTNIWIGVGFFCHVPVICSRLQEIAFYGNHSTNLSSTPSINYSSAGNYLPGSVAQ